MFRKSLSDKLGRIFELKKVTFDLPSESQEQECVFVEVEKCRNWIKPPTEYCRVQGKIRVFGASDKLPYGYFSKKLQNANLSDTRDLFFYDFEENAGTFRDIAERTMSFIYLFQSQYDPEVGVINELNTTYVES